MDIQATIMTGITPGQDSLPVETMDGAIFAEMLEQPPGASPGLLEGISEARDALNQNMEDIHAALASPGPVGARESLQVQMLFHDHVYYTTLYHSMATTGAGNLKELLRTQ